MAASNGAFSQGTVSFICDNPPVNKATDCFKNGIERLKDFCELTGEVSADNCDSWYQEGPYVSKGDRSAAWLCKFSSSNCTSNLTILKKNSSLPEYVDQRVCVTGPPGTKKLKKDDNYKFVSERHPVPSNHGDISSFEMSICVKKPSNVSAPINVNIQPEKKAQ